MREMNCHEVDAVSCYSDTTVTENDNFNLNTFNNYYTTRNRIVDEGLEIEDYEIKIVSNSHTRSLKLSSINNFIQMIVSPQDFQQLLGIHQNSLEQITVQHLIIYVFCNMRELLLDTVKYVNQVRLLHLGKKYAIEDFTKNRNMSLINDLKITECPSFHLVLTDLPISPLPLISKKFVIMNFFNHEEYTGSVTYAEAIVKKFKTNTNSRKSSVVSNTETLSDVTTTNVSLKSEGKFKGRLKRFCRF
ncbi:uncharacterized protein AC631_02675 [Debaryomyces fabryi]|uniref:Uncharacterized protein n=1 Tax=Debaryomyces fabryi TaxID=58627 RepID=A0A0V1PZH8_9ASCO|nr:uncharacterized protein AC631_02675 [Debaryomyces fabryi]KSA01530.1 hypothetical protein AC631_02675 [Debaryomyces fabryi]CUM51687.1 unnamed protein product [Debaryomyces fabryi]